MALGSASGSTMAASLPPSSIVVGVRFFAAAAAIRAPVAPDPVNMILSTSGFSTRKEPTSPAPLTVLITPAGNPSAIRRTISSVPMLVYSEGLITTVLPARIDGMICQIAISNGQFHGAMAAITPKGLRWISSRRVSSSNTTSTGRSKLAGTRVHISHPQISKRAPGTWSGPTPPSGFPCSRVTHPARTSAFPLMVSATFIINALRSASGLAAHAGCAARAAATACATCSAVDCGTRPSTSPVAGFFDSNVRAELTARPFMVF